MPAFFSKSYQPSGDQDVLSERMTSASPGNLLKMQALAVHLGQRYGGAGQQSVLSQALHARARSSLRCPGLWDLLTSLSGRLHGAPGFM